MYELFDKSDSFIFLLRGDLAGDGSVDDVVNSPPLASTFRGFANILFYLFDFIIIRLF